MRLFSPFKKTIGWIKNFEVIKSGKANYIKTKCCKCEYKDPVIKIEVTQIINKSNRNKVNKKNY